MNTGVVIGDAGEGAACKQAVLPTVCRVQGSHRDGSQGLSMPQGCGGGHSPSPGVQGQVPHAPLPGVQGQVPHAPLPGLQTGTPKTAKREEGASGASGASGGIKGLFNVPIERSWDRARGGMRAGSLLSGDLPLLLVGHVGRHGRLELSVLESACRTALRAPPLTHTHSSYPSQSQTLTPWLCSPHTCMECAGQPQHVPGGSIALEVLQQGLGGGGGGRDSSG